MFDDGRKGETMEEQEYKSTDDTVVDNNDSDSSANAELFSYTAIKSECGGSDDDAMFKYCFVHNLVYDHMLARRALILAGEQEADPAAIYRNLVAEDDGLKNLDFFSQLQRENFEQIYSERRAIGGLDEDTAKNRMAVMEILAYDPFKDDDIEDKPQLYRDMTGMLTEGMRKDVAKAKAALAIVRSYNNLDKYQRKINEIMKTGQMDDETQKALDQLIKVSKTLQDSINQTAEKNNFTVKGIGTSGHGMLSDVMNRINDYGIDEGVVNFYDIATSRAIEEVANISFKAQLN